MIEISVYSFVIYINDPFSNWITLNNNNKNELVSSRSRNEKKKRKRLSWYSHYLYKRGLHYSPWIGSESELEIDLNSPCEEHLIQK